jgi:hypothetical protein
MQRCFSFDKGSGTQRVTQNSVAELVVPMPGKKVLERRPGLRLSEIELPGTAFQRVPPQNYPWLDEKSL